jgi:hypothetical protein
MRRCWAPRGVGVAVEQTTGREHLNIHGAIDLETGTTQMLLVDRAVDVEVLASGGLLDRHANAPGRPAATHSGR